MCVCDGPCDMFLLLFLCLVFSTLCCVVANAAFATMHSQPSRIRTFSRRHQCVARGIRICIWLRECVVRRYHMCSRLPLCCVVANAAFATVTCVQIDPKTHPRKQCECECDNVSVPVCISTPHSMKSFSRHCRRRRRPVQPPQPNGTH